MNQRMLDLEQAALAAGSCNSTTILDADTHLAQLAINIERINNGGQDMIDATMRAIIACHQEKHAQPDGSINLIFGRPFINEVMGSAYLTVRSVYLPSL